MSPTNRKKLLEFLKEHGSSSISYSTLQSNLNYCLEHGYGYAAYGSHLNQRFVLGDPVCPSHRLGDFLDKAVSDLCAPAFIHIDRKTARLLHDFHGYKVTRMGVETLLPIQEYSLDGCSRKSRLRASVRKGKETATVYELDQESLWKRFGLGEKDLDELTSQWLSRKKGKRELRFLVREAVYQDEPYVRKFYSISSSGELQGFAFFDPIFDAGETIGYCPSVLRARPSAPMGHAAFMLFSAMEAFRDEGRKLLSLGLSPSRPSATPFRPDPFTHYGLWLLYHFGNRIYDFKGMRYYKSQFRGETRDAYFATRKRFSALETIAIARFSRFI